MFLTIVIFPHFVTSSPQNLAVVHLPQCLAAMHAEVGERHFLFSTSLIDEYSTDSFTAQAVFVSECRCKCSKFRGCTDMATMAHVWQRIFRTLQTWMRSLTALQLNLCRVQIPSTFSWPVQRKAAPALDWCWPLLCLKVAIDRCWTWHHLLRPSRWKFCQLQNFLRDSKRLTYAACGL